MPQTTALVEFTEQERRTPVIDWYRTPIPSAEMKALHVRSDFLGFLQTGGHLAIYAATACTAFYSWRHWPWWATLLLVFLHGTATSFLLNGIHELGHGTVFKTKWLNRVSVETFSFLNFFNHEMFQASHARHHRYTLHPPDDLEVVLPVKLMIRHFFLTSFFNPKYAWSSVLLHSRIARGHFKGEWELTCHPAAEPGKCLPAVHWARVLLIGHGLIAVVSLCLGYWIIPILVTLAPFYGGWLFFLCNNTQHIGLQDNVPDFRLCCRTFTLNPVVRFLYWQMNYHTEHHMYAAVPCYRLGRLHALIKHDLPPCPAGIIAVWKEIAAIQAKQAHDPAYQHRAPIPASAV